MDWKKTPFNILGISISIFGFYILIKGGTFGISLFQAMWMTIGGAIIFGGIPSYNWIFDKLKSIGFPILTLSAGVVIFYIQRYGMESFEKTLVGWILGWTVAGAFIYSIKKFTKD